MAAKKWLILRAIHTRSTTGDGTLLTTPHMEGAHRMLVTLTEGTVLCSVICHFMCLVYHILYISSIAHFFNIVLLMDSHMCDVLV